MHFAQVTKDQEIVGRQHKPQIIPIVDRQQSRRRFLTPDPLHHRLLEGETRRDGDTAHASRAWSSCCGGCGYNRFGMDCCNASVVSYRRLYTSARKVFLKRCKLILHHAPLGQRDETRRAGRMVAVRVSHLHCIDCAALHTDEPGQKTWKTPLTTWRGFSSSLLPNPSGP